MKTYERDLYGGNTLKVVFLDGECGVKNIDWWMLENVEEYEPIIVFRGHYEDCVKFIDNAFVEDLESRI